MTILSSILAVAMPRCCMRRVKRPITLGRDCRLSSDALRDLLIEGLLPSGIDVVDVGVVPTPLLYFSVLALENGRRGDDHRQP